MTFGPVVTVEDVIRLFVNRYLAHVTQLDELAESLAPFMLFMELPEPAAALVADIELWLAEYGRGDRSHRELRTLFADRLG